MVDMYYDRSLRNTVNDAYFRLKDERDRVFAERDYGSDYNLLSMFTSSSLPVSEMALTQTHILDKKQQTR